MGCDIHMWAEVKRTYLNPACKAEWRAVGRVFKNEYHEETHPVILLSDDWESNAKLTYHPYKNRNYVLFAFLANVRNGYGVAGCDTGDVITPIAMPRGIPEDASDYYKEHCEKYLEHTPSWLTLDELKNAKWDQKICKRGVLSEDEYKQYLEEGSPQTWCGGISGPNVICLTEKEYRGLKTKDPEKRYYIQVEWYPVLKDYCEEFYKETIPSLEKLLEWDYVQDVRIVFYFDS